jgi:hypothetical protein
VNAQIFYLLGQEELYRSISPLLKRYIFGDESIEIDRHVIGDDYATERGQTYLRLLKASMISTHEFTLLVEDSEGGYQYMGYERSHRANLLRLHTKAVPAVFPALAIMDRMVMVPKGIHDALSAENFLWILKPLEMGGVLLVDFHDEDSVREAARQVGIYLRAEIANLCRRQMLIHKSSGPNFGILSKLLKIEGSYFEKHQKEVTASMVRLTPSIISGPARLRKPSRVTIEIRNESEKRLEHVRVEVRAPKNAMKVPVVRTLEFPPAGGAAAKIEFEISPRATPYCPLEVLFEVTEMSPWYAPPSAPLILDVSGAALYSPAGGPLRSPPPR